MALDLNRPPPIAPLALTPGEPAGIGPDLVIALAAAGIDVPIVALADPRLLAERASTLGIALALDPVGDDPPREPAEPGRLWVEAHPMPVAVAPARPDPANAASLLVALDAAVDGCLAGRFSAMVTGPVNKAVIGEAGIAFSGHTEYIAARCGGAHPVMMLTGGGMRVALATTHLPLGAVAAAIDTATLERVIRIIDRDLRERFAVDAPRILVLGLNPHAGEDGHLGREERDIIEPVVAKLRGEGLRLEGPIPADTAFTPARLEHADVVLAMYHDQGLPVLKHASFGLAVNITLGLPVIRTSVDHGTAFDIAGTGRAEAGSLREALACAARMAARAAL